MGVYKRAVQFTPFAALRGYYEMLRERERVRVEKAELMEDAAEMLSRKLSRVEKGQLLEVIHYSDGEYISTTGLVSSVDLFRRKLTIVKTEIAMDAILELRGEIFKEIL